MAPHHDSRRSVRRILAALRRREERGASLVEYALLVALIAVVMVGAVTALGEGTSGSIDRSVNSIVDATTR